MKSNRLINSILVFMIIISFVSPQLVSAQKVKENTEVLTKIEVIAGKSVVYNMQDVEVGKLLEGIELSVIDQDDDKVYIQWGKERAYLFKDTVKVKVSDEKTPAETDIREEESFIKIISEELVNVYSDEKQSKVFFILEPKTAYFVEKSSDKSYEIAIGNQIGFVDATSVTLVNVEPEQEEIEDDLEIEEATDEILGSMVPSEKIEVIEEENSVEQALMQVMAQTMPFKASDKYFEPTERLTVYDNSSGSLVFVGYLNPGQSFPRIRDYGDWHEIKYGNGIGYVWKASTKPSTATSIQNLNLGLKNNGVTVKATSVLSVYDNSSGALVPFASLNKGVSYPVIGEMGEWYKIDVAGRIGHIYKPATTRDFVASDKYFKPTERVTVYDNSTGSLVFVGYLNPGQSFPRIRDYGDWHEIKYGNGTGYVWKASTKPSTAGGIKNLNLGVKNSATMVKATSVLSVYDNSSGALVQFASLNKDVSYPVISEMGDWYKIDIAGRIGHIYKPATIKVKTLPSIDLLLPNRNSEIRTTPITNVVLHFTSNAAVKPKNPYIIQDIYNVFVDYGVSAHYIIGRKGEIYNLVPESKVAYHAGKGRLPNFPQYENKLNDYSIGIEMMAVGTKKEMSSMISSATYEKISNSDIGYTEAQYKSLDKLIKDIIQRNPGIKNNRKHIVGHDEYAPGRKTDPGSLFKWSKIGL